jgi:Pentapeptide repeats (8 copies)
VREAGRRLAVLRAVVLRAVDLRAVDLRAVDLRGADLRAVDLRAVDFRAVDLRAVDLRAVVFRAPVLRAVDLRAVLRAVVFRAVDLRAVLRAVVFFAAVLRAVVFRAVDLRAVVLRAVLLRAVLLRAVVLRALAFLALAFLGLAFRFGAAFFLAPDLAELRDVDDFLRAELALVFEPLRELERERVPEREDERVAAGTTRVSTISSVDVSSIAGSFHIGSGLATAVSNDSPIESTDVSSVEPVPLQSSCVIYDLLFAFRVHDSLPRWFLTCNADDKHRSHVAGKENARSARTCAAATRLKRAR